MSTSLKFVTSQYPEAAAHQQPPPVRRRRSYEAPPPRRAHSRDRPWERVCCQSTGVRVPVGASRFPPPAGQTSELGPETSAARGLRPHSRSLRGPGQRLAALGPRLLRKRSRLEWSLQIYLVPGKFQGAPSRSFHSGNSK